MDEACGDDNAAPAGTMDINKIPTRNSIIKEFHEKIEAQRSNTVTMHVIKNSKHMNSKATMRKTYDDHGVGGDHCTMQGITSSSKYGRNKVKNDAIGRFLNSKTH